eukprot:sb/3473430/
MVQAEDDHISCKLRYLDEFTCTYRDHATFNVSQVDVAKFQLPSSIEAYQWRVEVQGIELVEVEETEKLHEEDEVIWFCIQINIISELKTFGFKFIFFHLHFSHFDLPSLSLFPSLISLPKAQLGTSPPPSVINRSFRNRPTQVTKQSELVI